MTSAHEQHLENTLKSVRWPLLATHVGMVAETAVRSLWPLFTVILLVLAVLMTGLQDRLPIELVWGGAVFSVCAAAAAVLYAVRRVRMPSRLAAMARLDASLRGRPLQAILDTQTIGAQDAASTAVWRAHQARMAKRAESAKPVPADLRVADRDPYALRYLAILAFGLALVFGSILRVGSVADLSPGTAIAGGSVWEGWAESPRYTGRPAIYLNDIDAGPLRVPEGSLITMRLYGEVGALTVSETVSGRTDVPPASDPAQDFTVMQNGEVSVNGPGGRSWSVEVIPDQPPEIAVLDAPTASAMGEMTLPFAASDDYGVENGEARFVLNLASVDRRHGLGIAPEPRPDLLVTLPTPIAGNRQAFEENLIEDFSEHPWANLPVEVSLTALDGAEQSFETEPRAMVLPGRRFFDPLAAAVIEQRRDLLWSRENARRISQVMRAISYLPDEVFRSETDALRLRQLIGRIETFASYGMTDEAQQGLSDDLWDLALRLEEGDLTDAAERLRRAQERLDEAIRNGASEEEIAALMRELRRATEDYLNQLAQQAQRQQEDGEGQMQPNDPNAMQMTQDDIQRMMDRIQELMEQGRMAEAQQALQELQQMLENMRVTQGQQGQGGQNPGEQAMEGLSEALREQQGLSDQAFRDLQEQFNPGARAGENQGNEGRNGGQGQGQSHEGQQGQQPGGNGQSGGNSQAQNGQPGQGGDAEGAIADRQRALRQELNRQQGNLPGAGSTGGDAAREALGRAGEAMEDAEGALRENDLAEAIDDQARAMEALREGMRALGEMMQQQQQAGQPGQGTQESDQRANARDPLGRESGSDGAEAGNGPLALSDNAYDRARDLLDEIRRRSSETARPEEERDYLNRLLDRF